MSNLKELCKRVGIKQVGLSKTLGVSQSVISDWMNDKMFPSVENLIELSNVLGVTVGCILGLEPIPDDYPKAEDKRPAHIKRVEASTKASLAEPSITANNPPFTPAQLSYIENLKKDIAAEVLDAIKEDTSLSKEA
ncbi:MAG: helix-turn-helix domain-containing protein [Clostridia bacterium]|nr:helix-turn-helix domain-containing protein [Clostridia bacterium]